MTAPSSAAFSVSTIHLIVGIQILHCLENLEEIAAVIKAVREFEAGERLEMEDGYERLTDPLLRRAASHSKLLLTSSPLLEGGEDVSPFHRYSTGTRFR
jgi:hypothetical protein